MSLPAYIGVFPHYFLTGFQRLLAAALCVTAAMPATTRGESGIVAASLQSDGSVDTSEPGDGKRMKEIGRPAFGSYPKCDPPPLDWSILRIGNEEDQSNGGGSVTSKPDQLSIADAIKWPASVCAGLLRHCAFAPLKSWRQKVMSWREPLRCSWVGT